MSVFHQCLLQFGENDYNVFLFGSQLTDRYKPDASDIDIAIYADNISKYIELRVFIEEYWREYDIPTVVMIRI